MINKDTVINALCHFYLIIRSDYTLTRHSYILSFESFSFPFFAFDHCIFWIKFIGFWTLKKVRTVKRSCCNNLVMVCLFWILCRLGENEYSRFCPPQFFSCRLRLTRPQIGNSFWINRYEVILPIYYNHRSQRCWKCNTSFLLLLVVYLLSLSMPEYLSKIL